MRYLNVIYDIDDTLVETLDVFFFSDNLLVLTYLNKIKKSEARIDFEKILTNLPEYLYLNKVIEQEMQNQPEDITQELFALKREIREGDDEVIEKWPKQGRNPFSPEGLEAAIENIVDKYELNLREKDVKYLSLIPFNYNLKKKYPLISIKDLVKESLEFKVRIQVYSKGDFRSQAKKIEFLGLKEVIPLDNLYITLKKDKETLKEIILQRDLSNTVVIGNSLKEEILPALGLKEMGVNALWVKHNDYFSRSINHIPDGIEIFSRRSLQKVIQETLYN